MDIHTCCSTHTHLIRGQVHTQMCHLFSRAHSTGFLSRHKVLKGLGHRRSSWSVCNLQVMLQQNPYLFRVCLGLDPSSQGWSINGTWKKEVVFKWVHDYLGDNSNLPSSNTKMSYYAARKQFKDKIFKVQVNKLCFCKKINLKKVMERG